MYEIKLIYPKHKQYTPSNEYCESITHTAVIDLFLRGVHAHQSSATRIILESERDRTYALLLLSSNPQYTVVSVD